MFTISLILTCELRYLKLREVNRKRGGGSEVLLPGRGANELPWGRNGLPGGPRVGGNYTD